MVRSHTPASRASTTAPAALDAQHDPEVTAENPAENAAAPPARTSEGPAYAWASEAPPSDRSPAARAPLEPLGSPPSPPSFRALRWDDREDGRAWLARARSHVADLAAVAREGARQSKHRVLSRSERSRQARAAVNALRELFDAAEAGLLFPSPPRGDRGE
jgi:hypothetical protein